MLGKQYMFSFSRGALEHKYMKHLNMYVSISCLFLNFSHISLRNKNFFFLSSFIRVLCLTLVSIYF